MLAHSLHCPADPPGCPNADTAAHGAAAAAAIAAVELAGVGRGAYPGARARSARRGALWAERGRARGRAAVVRVHRRLQLRAQPQQQLVLQRPQNECGSGLIFWLACGEGAGRGVQPALRAGPGAHGQVHLP